MAIVQSFVAEHPRTVGVVASVGVVIILAWRMRPRPGPNPFSKDSSRASRPLVTDKATRNKVLKQGKFKIIIFNGHMIMISKATQYLLAFYTNYRLPIGPGQGKVNIRSKI